MTMPMPEVIIVAMLIVRDLPVPLTLDLDYGIMYTVGIDVRVDVLHPYL